MVSSKRRELVLLLAALLAQVLPTHTFPIWSNNHHPTFQTSTAVRSQNLPDTLLVDNGADEQYVPHLTVVIPAYNEEFRIRETLESHQHYFANSDRWKEKARILVVDDGSTDGTADLVRRLGTSECKDHIPIDCLSLGINQGKGAALARGIQEAWEQYPSGLILTTDADGSADISGLEDLYDSLVSLLREDDTSLSGGGDVNAIHWDEAAMINGYRTYESASASRLIFRWGFRTVVRSICGNLGVKDSQCGFKLMTAAAGVSLYRNLYVQGWSHDVEVLYRARLLGIRVTERSILWEDKMGSKLVSSPGGLITVILKMFWEVVRIRVSYASGRWRLEDRL